MIAAMFRSMHIRGETAKLVQLLYVSSLIQTDGMDHHSLPIASLLLQRGREKGSERERRVFSTCFGYILGSLERLAIDAFPFHRTGQGKGKRGKGKRQRQAVLSFQLFALLLIMTTTQKLPLPYQLPQFPQLDPISFRSHHPFILSSSHLISKFQSRKVYSDSFSSMHPFNARLMPISIGTLCPMQHQHQRPCTQVRKNQSKTS